MVSSVSESTVTEVRQVRTRRYRWPALQLNFWLLVMIVGSAVNLGVFANFITIQNQLLLGIPWYVLTCFSIDPILTDL